MWPGRWRGEGVVIAGCPSSPALGEAEIAPSAGDSTGTSRRCSQRARSWDDAVASRPPPPRGPAGEPPTTRRGRSGSGWDCATTMVRPGSPGRKRQPVSEWLRSRERAVATGTSAKRLVQNWLSDVPRRYNPTRGTRPARDDGRPFPGLSGRVVPRANGLRPHHLIKHISGFS